MADRRDFRSAMALAILALAFSSCSSSTIIDDSPLALLDPSQPRSADPAVLIRATGVFPDVVHMNSGPVRFTNEDQVEHTLAAAPDLGYGDCPEMASLGALAPGQGANLTLTRLGAICAFHDAAHPTSRSFQGILVVH